MGTLEKDLTQNNENIASHYTYTLSLKIYVPHERNLQFPPSIAFSCRLVLCSYKARNLLLLRITQPTAVAAAPAAAAVADVNALAAALPFKLLILAIYFTSEQCCVVSVQASKSLKLTQLNSTDLLVVA